ncbi:DMT family transporter [Chelatococcus asaccharovorans]|uniref:DMT family transporter n=1 Tax=Chelatococcus asaccharovorans TaxID=28210 RepID=UPI00224C6357|nr:DMT family transporter [Chelatococcus asaccharovorans]CAH1662858.1 Permease of the drug/metabolite transporter (DMT) superfamily [Chelatococcus asaccharovorans]CAH1683037.1 Permease of the drug/metabolite transporter (DMT) superfamily [Chelatococcus asaccharovorans]
MSVSPSANRAMTWREWAMLMALSALWGGSFFFNAVAIKELPVFTVVVARVGLAAIILLTVLRMMGQPMPTSRRIWAAFFGMGLLNNAIPFSLIVWGQQQIASGAASILNASTPLFTVLFAHVLTTDEKLTGNRLLGVLIGFLGVAVMVGFDALSTLGGHVAAQLMCLAAAISYALAGIFGRRFHAMGVAPMVTAAGQVTASSLMLIPVMLIVDRPWTLPMPSLEAIGALIGVAALSTALGYVLFFRILATAGATNLLLVTFLIPVSAILLGVLVLNETLMPKQLAGMALISLGLAAIDGRPWRLLHRQITAAVGRA